MPRRAAKVDANHADVKGWLQDLAWFIVDTHEAPQYKAMRGMGDQLAIQLGVVVVVEVKAGKGESLTKAEAEFAAAWIAAGGNYEIVTTLDDCMAMTNKYIPGRVS